MKSVTSHLLILWFALIALSQTASYANAQVISGADKLSVAASTLPDLIVVSVDSDNLDNGVVKVKIKNQGQRNAARALVALTMTWGSKTLNFTRSDSGKLQPGQMDIVIFDVKLSLVQAKFCATVDATNKVIEDNENNNKQCGQFGGKP